MEILVGSILGIAVGLFTMIRRGGKLNRDLGTGIHHAGRSNALRRNLSPIAGQTWMLGRATRMMTAKGPSDDRQHRVNFEFGCKSWAGSRPDQPLILVAGCACGSGFEPPLWSY